MTDASNPQSRPAERTLPGKNSIVPERIGPLPAALEAEQRPIEDARQILRLQAAEVEQELVQWTRQQAELQKVQVAIDQLLRISAQARGKGKPQEMNASQNKKSLPDRRRAIREGTGFPAKIQTSLGEQRTQQVFIRKQRIETGER